MASVSKRLCRPSVKVQDSAANRSTIECVFEDESFYNTNLINTFETKSDKLDLEETLSLAHQITKQDVTLKTAVLEPEEDPTSYKMNHQNRGKCIIFSHHTFNDEFPSKTNARQDGVMMETQFNNLSFKTELCLNFTLAEIQDKLTEVTLGKNNQDFTRNSDCLVIVVLSHEGNKGQFWASDRPYPVNMLWTHLLAGDKTHALAGKPLILFLDCTLQKDGKKGDTWDTWGVNMETRDLLIVHSTVGDGNGKGSLFARSLCHELQAKRAEDFFSTLVSVNKSLVNNPAFVNNRHTPRLLSTFTKTLFFQDKPNPIDYCVMDVYNLAKALKTYLEVKDKELDEQIVDDGDVILDQISEWDRLSRKKRDVARLKLSFFCQQNHINV